MINIKYLSYTFYFLSKSASKKEATTGLLRSLLLYFFSHRLMTAVMHFSSDIDVTRNLVINYIVSLIFLRLNVDAEFLNL